MSNEPHEVRVEFILSHAPDDPLTPVAVIQFPFGHVGFTDPDVLEDFATQCYEHSLDLRRAIIQAHAQRN